MVVMEQLILFFSEKNDVCMIKSMLFCMLQLGYYGIKMQGFFQMFLLISMQVVLVNIKIDCYQL